MPATEAIDLSVVVPVYGSPASLEELVTGIEQAASEVGAALEIVLVDDRCPHGSWQAIQELASKHASIKGVRLSRNFGQHAAIFAGLEHAGGSRIAVMDCDLQDRPSELAVLYRKALEGFQVVRARRVRRQDSLWRKFVSKSFYSALSYLTNIKHSEEIANFGVYDRKVIDTILSWKEDRRFFPSAVQWAGFKVCDVAVEHSKRKHGQSNYNFAKLFDLALSIIISFSDKPLRIITFSGLILSILVIFLSIIYTFVALLGGFDVPGWASIIVSVWLLSSMLMISIGVSGLYIGQAMREAKGRPNSVVDEVIERSDVER